MTVSFSCRAIVRASIAETFDLARDLDEHVASMARFGERAVDGVTSGLLGLGEEVTWKARHFGVGFTMTSRMTELECPTRFVDEQVRGPFRQFRHEHRFTEVDQGTEMLDLVQFAAPFGSLGWVTERLVLERYLRDLIERRNRHLVAVASARRAS